MRGQDIYVHVQACTILARWVHIKVGLLLSAISLANTSNDYVQFLSFFCKNLNAVSVATCTCVHVVRRGRRVRVRGMGRRDGGWREG